MENTIWIEDQFLKADKLYDNGEYSECKRLLLDLLDDEPGCGKAHCLLGWIYYSQLDDFERATCHMKMAIRFAPAYPAAFVNYLFLLNYLNRYDELLAHVENALKVDGVPKCLVYRELGKSHELNGSYKKASKAYKEALRFSTAKHEVDLAEESMNRVKQKIAMFTK
jgi:tetratricopeptide (TPR) repeat protein